YYAVLHHKKINAGYIPRFDTQKVSMILNNESRSLSEGMNDHYVYISLEPYVNRLILPLSKGQAYVFKLDNYIVFFSKNEKTRALAEYIARSVETSSDIRSTIMESAQLKVSESTLPVTKQARASFYETDVSADQLYLKGWCFIEPGEKAGEETVQIVLESEYPVKR